MSNNPPVSPESYLLASQQNQSGSAYGHSITITTYRIILKTKTNFRYATLITNLNQNLLSDSSKKMEPELNFQMSITIATNSIEVSPKLCTQWSYRVGPATPILEKRTNPKEARKEILDSDSPQNQIRQRIARPQVQFLCKSF